MVCRSIGRYIIVTSPNRPGLLNFSRMHWKKWEGLGTKLVCMYSELFLVTIIPSLSSGSTNGSSRSVGVHGVHDVKLSLGPDINNFSGQLEDVSSNLTVSMQSELVGQVVWSKLVTPPIIIGYTFSDYQKPHPKLPLFQIKILAPHISKVQMPTAVAVYLDTLDQLHSALCRLSAYYNTCSESLVQVQRQDWTMPPLTVFLRVPLKMAHPTNSQIMG